MATIFLLFVSGLAPAIFAQGTVSSGLTGLVRDSTGSGIGRVAVTARHEPTGTTYTTMTNLAGRYTIAGMVIGGPYTVSATADGFQSTKQTNVETQLGSTIDVNFAMEAGASDVISLDKFTVQAESTDLDSAATGAGGVINSAAIASTPTVQRSFADVARTNAFVALRGILASRTQPIISAVGQNNRFNSIQVDGARINDQFGLNGSGVQSFGNPISLDMIEQFHISISPYDVGQSGFTGVSINAVTKSGTNQFRGSVNYYYTNDDLQSRNVFGATAGTRAPLKQETRGFTFGGPIIRNKLFFFLGYEKFDSTISETAALDPTASAQGTADLAAINARLAAIKTALSYGSSLDFGNYIGRTAGITTSNEVQLAKIDWNIISGQRLSVRYSKTEGELPASGRYTLTNFGAQTGSNPVIAAAPFASNFSSNRFLQAREEEVWTGQLFSQWTPEFKTELRYSQVENSQATPTPISFPEIRIFGVGGVASTGATITNGALVLGTEVNRQGNFLATKTQSFSASGEYLFNNITFSGGFDRDQSDFVNLFRSSSYGVFDFASVQAFVNDTPSTFGRSVYKVGTPVDDVSDYSATGIFGQGRMDIGSRLNITFGSRYDFFATDRRPPLNTQFQQAFGFANTGTVDGADAISPRVSFNYALNESRDTQVRGGLGHFVGRVPWVLISNSYSNSGVGRGNITVNPNGPPNNGTLLAYLQNSFSPTNPIGSAPDVSVTRPIMNLAEDGISPPSVWRANLAVEQKLPTLSSVISVEAIFTRSSKALFIQDLNIKPRFTGSDGRQVYSGSLANAANALKPEFQNVYALSNIKEGESTYVAFTLQRPMKNKWSYNLTYTRGESEDALPAGETVAASLYQRNPVFNQNQIDVTRSAFEVRDRVQASISRQFEIKKGWKTTASLYYEGRTGNPYSFVYNSDANADGVTGNDLVYVPTGVNDPVLAGLTPAVAQSIVDYVNGSELSSYKGRVAPRHAFVMPWTNRLDLHFAQEIPLYKPAHLEIFADFVNFGAWLSKDFFGYYETLTGTGDNELLAIKAFGAASYDANTRQLLMTGTSFPAPAMAVPNNELSRWRIQFGARLKF